MADDRHECLNCGGALPEGAGWCPWCGQKVPRTLVPTFGELLHDGIETFFNLDHRIWRTLATLFRPGALTLAWLQGKRARYYPPFRIFFVAALAYFALDTLTRTPDAGIVQVEGRPLTDLRQTRARYLWLDSLRQAAPDWYPAAPRQAREVLDTLLARMPSPCGDTTTFTTIDGRSLRFCERDLFALSPSEFFARYEVGDFWTRLSLTLVMKGIQSPEALNEFLLAHFVWFLTALLPLLAALSRLVFRKARQRYVVHLVMLLHLTSFVFVLLAAMRVLALTGVGEAWIAPALVVLIPAWDLVATRRCLGLSWRATLWRWTLFGLLAVLVFALGLVVYAVVSLSLL